MKKIKSTIVPLITINIIAFLLLPTLVTPAIATEVTWNLNATLADGGSVNGWFTYDASISTIPSGFNIKVDYPSPFTPTQMLSLTLTPPTDQAYGLGTTHGATTWYNGVEFFASGIAGISIDNDLEIFTDVEVIQPTPTNPLTIDTTNSFFVSDVYNTGTGFYTDVFTSVVSGELTAEGYPFTASEPSALLLIGTGLAGLLVLGQSRFKRI